MRCRPLIPSDIKTLKSLYEQQGFQYDFPDLTSPHMESVMVVVDENEHPLCACAAERLVQCYFFSNDFGPPHAKLHAMRMLHDSMTDALRKKGYDSAEAFLPPTIDKRFGRWLERRFSWVKNWNSWCFRF